MLRFWIPDFTIVKRTVFHVVQSSSFTVLEYVYKGRIFKCIGDKVPPVARGFFIPIRKIVWNGKDVTKEIMPFAGPRHDFYGKRNEIIKLFFRNAKRLWKPKVSWYLWGLKIEFEPEYSVESEDGQLEVVNLFGNIT